MAVLAMLVLSGCGRDQPASALVGSQTFDPSDREPMPALAGTTLAGRPLDLASLRGKVVVLNTWASWCTPCRTEIPTFVALDEREDPADVAVVGLNVQDDPAAAHDFANDFHMAYPSIEDSDGALLATVPGVPPSALPSTVVLDRDGRIAARIIGEADPGELTRTVDSLVAEPAGGPTAGSAPASVSAR